MFCCCCFRVESCCVSAHSMCVGCAMWTLRGARECRGLSVHDFKSGDSSSELFFFYLNSYLGGH